MSDSSDDQVRQLRANYTALKKQCQDIAGHTENAAWALGKREGFIEGWNAGYDYAQQRFQELLRLQPQAPPMGSTQPKEPTAADIVLQIIRIEPGLRGVEIVEKTQQLAEPLKERTVRTALHRLKEARKIQSDQERWYAVAEADGQTVEERMT